MEEQNRNQESEMINSNEMDMNVPSQMQGDGVPIPPQTPPMQEGMAPIPPQTPPMQGYGAPIPPYGYNGHPTSERGMGLAIASMVLGIISIITCAWFYLALPCAIIGLILGCVYRGKGGRNGMSIAGIVCSSIGLVFSLFLLVCVAFSLLLWA